MAKKKLTSQVKDRIRRMKWWHEAQFGMFVHWGLYALIGHHEWAMRAEGIPVDEYEQLAKKFKPRPNAAREWAKLAKRCGMNYMVMTTKHHDGFCLFDSQHTDYCAPRHACARDLVAEYVAAARAEGLRVGFYYSLGDWHHPDGSSCAWDEAARKRFVQYTHNQVRDLCTNYGTVDIMWYDGGFPLDAKGWESVKLNRMVRKLQPDILINDRAGIPEDFNTPEQRIGGEIKNDGRGWESCITMNGENWGCNTVENDWKSPVKVAVELICCARGGGNYLLNVGPKHDGSIQPRARKIIENVGGWATRNRDAVFGVDRVEMYGSRYACFTRRGKTLYVNFYYWPGETSAIAGLRTKVKSARLLATGEPVEFRQERFRVIFTGLPRQAPDQPLTTIALECASPPLTDPEHVWDKSPRGKN